MPEHDVAALSDLPEGQPVKVEAGDRALVVIRRGEDVSALTHECPHLGLPLSKGVVRGDTLMCAFHHACFDIRTGAQAEPPGHGDLQRFASVIRDGRVIVDVPEDAPAHPVPARAEGGIDGRTVLIAGAGCAAHEAAATLREEGFAGTVAMIAPDGPPLDRTMLSKAVLAGGKSVDDLPLAPDLAALDVALTDDRVVAVEPGRVRLASGGTRAFDALLVAPGGTPRSLGLEGEALPGVHVLRSGPQAEALAADAGHARSAVVIGGGFIGLEGALSLGKRGLSVTLATREARPLAKIVGDDVADAIMAELREAGVAHRPETEAARFTGNGRVAGVEWKDGGGAPADLVLMAVGVTPATAEIDGLPTEDDGGVAVGPDLSVPGLDGVWVAGDCARAPTPFGPARIEHWRVAAQHGRRAARAILGLEAEGADIPFFWSALGRQYRYLGHAEGFDRIDLDGDPRGAFVARYLSDGRVVAALTAGRDADLAGMHLRMREIGGPLDA